MEHVAGPGRRVTYISWAQSCSRSDHTARELGGRSHMVYAARFGSHPATILFKYAVQWIRTARILKREQPDAVFVMTPPVVAALPAFWYAWRRGKQVVLDAHTAAFLHPRWRRWQPLQRLLCRRAATTLTHNEHLADRVRAAGGHVTIVPDVPIIFAERGTFDRPPGFVVAAVCSFNYDEPIAEILTAAEALPDVTFFVTGDPRHLDAGLKSRLPANVRLTGFLSTADYGDLITSANVVLTLTTRDHTMLRGAYEAVYQGTPVIVSDWPLLRDAFPMGGVHVDNTAAAIVRAVWRVQAEPARFRAEAGKLRQLRRSRWESTRQAIVDRVFPAGCIGSSSPARNVRLRTSHTP
jgi:glycosyltransferase involved in cell wall biosynthesis